MTAAEVSPTPQEPVAQRPASSVTVYPDGPLIVRGDFELRELDGEPITGGHTIALCRCGRSAVKPFCDGSHKVKSLKRGRRAGK